MFVGKLHLKKKKRYWINCSPQFRKIYQFCNFCCSLFVQVDASLLALFLTAVQKSHFLLLAEAPSSELARPARGSDGLLGRPHQPFQFAFSSRVPLSVFN